MENQNETYPTETTEMQKTEPDLKQHPDYDPKMEEILSQLETMSQSEIQAFAMQNPQLVIQLQKYARKTAPQTSVLKNKKTTVRPLNMDEYRSKKKKAGGKKGSRKKAKK